MLNKKELKQLARLERMRTLESHRPLVIESLNTQINIFKTRQAK